MRYTLRQEPFDARMTDPRHPPSSRTAAHRDTHRGAAASRPRRPPPARRMRLGERDVVSEGLTRGVLQDLYHYFMTVTWPVVFLTLAAFFIVFDTLFAGLYALRPGCVANLNPPGFWGAFFFSVETLATVGYGDMHPQTPYGHLVSMVETFVGLMMLAIITGIMFARFSRPRARFLFSSVGVIRPLEGVPTLLFRTANARQNVVQEASAQLRMLRNEESREGYRLRKIADLALVRSQHPAFALGWTLMHVIDAASPLHGESAASLERANASFILTLSGTDETTGQVLFARASYPCASILWNHSFVDIIEELEDGTLHVDFARFHDVEAL